MTEAIDDHQIPCTRSSCGTVVQLYGFHRKFSKVKVAKLQSACTRGLYSRDVSVCLDLHFVQNICMPLIEPGNASTVFISAQYPPAPNQQQGDISDGDGLQMRGGRVGFLREQDESTALNNRVQVHRVITDHRAHNWAALHKEL